ncbi:hypothetical protein GWK47_028952 [Chionoecetes opilio]|uniref:Uncharacterized protein n=1 Tax=Chionoecetes opilio TaxID=41210 RepID=A0A8J5D5V4_CHIOP|nr:hypothetical protein GWK47_028952 [Chionoecetes opilio]
MSEDSKRNIGDLASIFHHRHPRHHCSFQRTLPGTLLSLPTFEHDPGIFKMAPRDRAHGTFGGIDLCFLEGLAVEALEGKWIGHLEMMFLSDCVRVATNLLLCVCERPQWQGNDPIHFLHSNI